MSEKPIPAHRQGIREVVKKVIDEQFGRAKWQIDHEVYDLQDEEEQQHDSNMPLRTRTLQARTQSLKLDDQVGKRKIVVKEGPKKDQAGFHCSVCDENFLDSDSYIMHLNSELHNRKLGMNMKVERVDTNKIKEKFQSVKRISSQEKNDTNKQPTQLQLMVEIQKKLQEEMGRKKLLKEQKLQKKTLLNENLEKIIESQPKKVLPFDDEDDDIKEMLRLGLPISTLRKKEKKRI